MRKADGRRKTRNGKARSAKSGPGAQRADFAVAARSEILSRATNDDLECHRTTRAAGQKYAAVILWLNGFIARSLKFEAVEC